MTRILYERGMIKALASHFGVTDQTVRNALRGITEGEQPDLIRREALKRGAVQKPFRIRISTKQ